MQREEPTQDSPSLETHLALPLDARDDMISDFYGYVQYTLSSNAMPSSDILLLGFQSPGLLHGLSLPERSRLA